MYKDIIITENQHDYQELFEFDPYVNFNPELYLESIEEFVEEKLTKEEYSKKKFKEKYNFKPSKENPNIGTITINGNKRTIDMGNSKKIDLNGYEANRAFGANRDAENPKVDIYLDKKYFKLKNQRRRDAALQHEEAHIRYQSNDKRKDPRFNKNDLYKIQQLYLKHNTKKYAKPGTHANEDEFEADRVAANKTSKSDMLRTIRNFATLAKKEMKSEIYKNPSDYIENFDKIPDKDKKDAIEKRIKTVAKDVEDDYIRRTKALKDPLSRKAALYKEYTSEVYLEHVDYICDKVNINKAEYYKLLDYDQELKNARSERVRNGLVLADL